MKRIHTEVYPDESFLVESSYIGGVALLEVCDSEGSSAVLLSATEVLKLIRQLTKTLVKP